MLQAITWWLIVQILGWLALPLSFQLFRRLPDRGYTAAKALGLLLVSYLLAAGASFDLLRNDTGGILLAGILAGWLSGWFYFRHKIICDNSNNETTISLISFIRTQKKLILTVEMLFVITFLTWVTLRAYAAEKIMSSGGEKFMEIAFLNGTLNSSQFPPLDPWLSGFGISYYYFGYVMMALLTKLSGVSSGIGFDLYNSLLFGLTIIGAFGIVYNLIAGTVKVNLQGENQASNNRQLLRYGLLGPLFVVIIGNLEGMLEAFYAKGLMPKSFWTWIDIPDLVTNASVVGSWYPGHSWWWWRGSRVLRDQDLLHQPVPVNSITEFPFFSFLLGDNHPHVLALPFVLLTMTVALNLLYETIKGDEINSYGLNWWSYLSRRYANHWVTLILYGLILGALGFLNTWDFPIYLCLTTLAYGVGCYARSRQITLKLIQQTTVLGAVFGFVGIVLYIFFYVSFSSQAGGLLPYLFPPTRLPQYLIMFGPFIFIITWFLITRLLHQNIQYKRELLKAIFQTWGLTMLSSISLFIPGIISIFLAHPGYPLFQELFKKIEAGQALNDLNLTTIVKAIVTPRLQNPWLFLIISLLIAISVVNIRWSVRISDGIRYSKDLVTDSLASDFFALLLIFTGLVLTLSVEFVYLRDDFGTRMNTVFKFYYQGWIMFACASAYGVWWMFNKAEMAKTISRFICLGGVLILVTAGMVYPLMASYSRIHGFQSDPDLNGASNIIRDHPDDWAAIQWLQVNTRGTPVILEAPGRSYNYEGRISAFTGLPTVLGWSLHEAQWRGNYNEQSKREPDIAIIYTTYDDKQTLDLLHKWQVKYVIVGSPERRFIEQLCGNDPNYHCSVEIVLKKFNRILKPVFTQRTVVIYQVPG